MRLLTVNGAPGRADIHTILHIVGQELLPPRSLSPSRYYGNTLSWAVETGMTLDVVALLHQRWQGAFREAQAAAEEEKEDLEVR